VREDFGFDETVVVVTINAALGPRPAQSLVITSMSQTQRQEITQFEGLTSEQLRDLVRILREAVDHAEAAQRRAEERDRRPAA